MRITIKDIAERAGVSKTTVSFAFNDPNKISAETRDRVLAIAAELGYVPDPVARTLITKKIGSIGLLLPQPIHFAMSNPYLTELIQGIGEVCHKHNFSLTIIPPAKGRIIEAAQNALVDGLITIGVNSDMKIIEFLMKRHLPFVTIDGTATNRTINVGIDDERAGYILMRYVLDLGHRKIALVEFESSTVIHPEDEFSVVRDRRVAGFARALGEKGMGMDDVRIFSTQCSMEGGRRVGMEILSGERPTAVVALADIIALGFYTACQERNVRIPDDISVVGFDDIQMAAAVKPGLTTIRQPAYAKGFEAGLVMFSFMEKGSAYHRLMPAELVVRESSVPPRG
jgi:DNA-binding LacI/PurR family transcriptional regulator